MKRFTLKTELPELAPAKVNKRLPWPEEVKVLESKDFCEGTFHYRSQSCLQGHALKVAGFKKRNAPNIGTPEWHEAVKVVEAVLDRVEDYLKKMGWEGNLAPFNDVESTRAFRAKLMNRVYADLGYTEGNPEADV